MPDLLPISDGIEFGRPRLIEGRDSTVVVFDYTTAEITATHLRRGLLWRVGGSGAGPREFGAVMDLSIGGNGDVWALDNENGRIAILDTEGTHRRLIEMGPRFMQRLAVTATDTLAALHGTDSTFLVAIRSDGDHTAVSGHPIPKLAEADPYFQQILLTSDGGSRWAAVSLLGGDLAVGRSGELICQTELVTTQSVGPDDVPSPDWGVTAAGVGVREGYVYVLARPPGDMDLKVLDVYLSGCLYSHSIPLPQKVLAIAAVAAGIVVAIEDPEPRLLLLRLNEEGRPEELDAG